ncbi:hypothetical protein J7M23_02590, partial [Candidatus Sumerlaeota bacterium]|nr:hypothetical protein [Candidatus Sumerlaeota bacterium]
MNYKKVLFLSLLLVLASCMHIMAETIIIDNRSDDFVSTGSWNTGTSPGYQVTNYLWIESVTGSETACAAWFPTFESAGSYEVAVWYVDGTKRSTDVKFTVNHSGGSSIVYVDQTTNGSEWVVLGTYDFPATGGSVEVSNLSSVSGGKVV